MTKSTSPDRTLSGPAATQAPPSPAQSLGLSGLVRAGLRDLIVRPPGNVAPLDALRAMAVLLVICTHFAFEFWPDTFREEAPRALGRIPFFYWGWTGVDLFFVLSGYLIGRQLWKERERTGTIRMGEFILRRGFRIWPLYFVMLGLFALISPTIYPNWWDLTFLSNYGPGGLNRGWSLSSEEQFYIVFPIILLGTLWIRRVEWFFVLLVALLVGEFTVRSVTAQELFATGLTRAKVGNGLYSPLHFHSSPLIAGLIIALASVRWPARFKNRGKGLSGLGFAIFVGCSALGLMLRAKFQLPASFLALALVYGSLTLWMLWDGSIVARIASAWPFYPISRLSYGMYLNHFLVFPTATSWTAVTIREATGSVNTAFWGGLLVGTAVSIAVAVVTFVAVEHPFLVLRERLLARNPHGDAPVKLPSGEGYPGVGARTRASDGAAVAEPGAG